MGRPVKTKKQQNGEKGGDGNPNPTPKPARKKPRYHPGTVRTRQKVRAAVKAESVVPMAFFRRAILEASGGEVRWTKNAVAALKAIVEAKVHRTLALGSTLARVANKKTLNNVPALSSPEPSNDPHARPPNPSHLSPSLCTFECRFRPLWARFE